MPGLKFAPIILGLLAFTNPQGVTIYIDADSIAAVSPGVGYCKEGATRLLLGTESQCVDDGVESVVAKIRKDAGKPEKEEAGE